jgi:hypothetical protein
MASKKMKPPAAADAGRLRNTITATAICSENNAPKPEIQDHRAAWLARRFHLSLSTAAAVAALHFGEVRA